LKEELTAQTRLLNIADETTAASTSESRRNRQAKPFRPALCVGQKTKLRRVFPNLIPRNRGKLRDLNSCSAQKHLFRRAGLATLHNQNATDKRAIVRDKPPMTHS